MTYTVSQARKHFERLVREVEAGREIVITRNGVAVVKATPWREPQGADNPPPKDSSGES